MTENSLPTLERKLIEALSAIYRLDTDQPVLSRQRTARALEGVSTLAQHVRGAFSGAGGPRSGLPGSRRVPGKG